VSGNESYPPPGAAGQDPPPPSYPPPGTPEQPPWQPGGPPGLPPGMLGATHRPGAIPLRPLQLGDIYDAAFRIIRHNPRATVGSAVLVTAVAMLIPVLSTAALAWTVDLSVSSDADLSDTGVIGALGSQVLGLLLQSVGLILVTGMIAHVTMAAAVGRKLSLGEAWAATRGKRARLFGLVLLLAVMMVLLIALFVLVWLAAGSVLSGVSQVLFVLASIPAFAAALWWFWIRIYYLPVPALMLEDVGVFGAIERGYALTGRSFWRIFGIATLTTLITLIASAMLTVPIGLASGAITGSGGTSSELDAVWSSLVGAVTAVVQSAFVAPFTATVTSLLYVDQRIRKEAFDVELMTRAGVPGR
jgi:hypothetical protein